MSPAETRFACAELIMALKRYRFNTLLGWTIALVGCLSVPFGWRYAGTHGLLDLCLSGGTVLAGLALVQQSVATLSAYLRISFRLPQDEKALPEESPVVTEIRQIINQIEEGGWQEAYTAINTLEETMTRLT